MKKGVGSILSGRSEGGPRNAGVPQQETRPPYSCPAVAVADAARAAAGRNRWDRFPSPAGSSGSCAAIRGARADRNRLVAAAARVARDYYRIETAAGRCYWVFRRLPAGPWFLHGMFD